MALRGGERSNAGGLPEKMGPPSCLIGFYSGSCLEQKRVGFSALRGPFQLHYSVTLIFLLSGPSSFFGEETACGQWAGPAAHLLKQKHPERNMDAAVVVLRVPLMTFPLVYHRTREFRDHEKTLLTDLPGLLRRVAGHLGCHVWAGRQERRASVMEWGWWPAGREWLWLAASTCGLAFLAYCLYFDRKRRGAPNFKRRLREKRRKEREKAKERESELSELKDAANLQDFFLQEIQVGEIWLAKESHS
ncbi:TOMM20-like protein 1 isoform X2 [Pogona vitticeps]